ncbi:MAG: hypothetical protein AABY22_27355, partial [Nanoarchaeota archaeon]
MEDQKWFQDLKENKFGFKKTENRIEYAKFKYEREVHLTEWILGVGLAVFFSVNISNMVSTPGILKNWAVSAYIISLLST